MDVDFEDGERVVHEVESMFLFSSRRIMIASTMRREAAWLELEETRYRARFLDSGLSYLMPENVMNTVAETLARQHVRIMRREGFGIQELPRYAPARSWPALPALVYEWGRWVTVERPTTAAPGLEDAVERVAEVDHDQHRLRIMRNLPRPRAWYSLWHERYEVRLYESGVLGLMSADLKEALCDGLAAARVLEAHMMHDWKTHPEAHPAVWGRQAERPATRSRRGVPV
jgi:hypothetical protein